MIVLLMFAKELGSGFLFVLGDAKSYTVLLRKLLVDVGRVQGLDGLGFCFEGFIVQGCFEQ